MTQKSTGWKFKSWEVVYVYDYPEGFGEVLEGNAYWNKPMEILGYDNVFDVLGGYMPDVGMHWVERRVDMNHPKCYYCGRFVKKGDWWKSKLTGPCEVCYERIPRW